MQTSPNSLRATSGIPVVVLHSDAIVAAGLAETLAREPGITVERPMGASQDQRNFGDRVVVADPRRGMALLAQRDGPNPPKVVIVADEPVEREVREALDRGALGYLTVDSPLAEVVEGARCAGRGARYLGQRAAQLVGSADQEALTTREIDVLELLAQGLANKSIARELRIAIGTVKTHLSAVLAKLEANSRCQAVAVATRRGLV